MFTCHFSVYSSGIIKQVNGIRLGFDGAQDHDLALRISEIVTQSKVVHIPRVLYHWRAIPGSAAMFIEEKPKAPASGRKAVCDALERRKLKGIVTSNKMCPTLYQIEFQPTSYPEVTIIIPTRNSLALLEKCIESIRSHTRYPHYNILIIDNHSDDEGFLEYVRAQESQGTLQIMCYEKPFNHSEMNNMAVQSVSSELVVFINNDIEIISDNWLEQLVATVNIEETVACAGCLLLYKNKTVQHGGIILGLHGIAGHSHQYLYSDSPGYNCRLLAVQEMTAVTAALMIAKKSVFEKVGGFNSQRYPTLLNDVDLCLRFGKEGYRCLYNPMVKAYHYESRTRPIKAREHEYRKRFKEDYCKILLNDPFYNPNLSLNNRTFYGLRDFPITDQIPILAKFGKKG
jgi:GT2 family glycosyltransferase